MSTSTRRADAVDDTSEPAPRQRRRRRRSRAVLVSLVVVLLAVAGLYAAGYVMAGDNLPRNARVAGVAIGGMDEDAAVRKLRSALQPRATRPIPVRIATTTDLVDPTAAGLSIDYQRSVARAGAGKSLDPRHIWRVLTGGQHLEPVIAVDQTRLRAAVDGLAAEHDAEPVDATLAYQEARIISTKATPGVVVDREAAVEALRESYLQTDGTVAIPAEVVEPAITDEDIAAVVRDYAKPAVAAPIRLRADDAGSMAVTPAMIGRSTTFEPRDGTVVPKLDSRKLFQQARSEIRDLDLRTARNADVRLIDGRPRVIPGTTGATVTRQHLTAAVTSVLTKSGKQRTASLKLAKVSPDLTTAEARNLRVRQVTGSFTTYFPYAAYRNVNIGRAAEKINGTLLEPGEVFSLNGIVGERTRENGFVEGNIITGGKFRMELGGGVSQSATTTFNAMFFAGLKDIQHQPHSLYIDRYPAGREATVAWPSLDLKFQNDTRYGVLVQAFVNRASPGGSGSITVRMWSSKSYDKVASSKLRRSNYTSGRDVVDTSPDCQPMSPVPGFDVNYSRLFYRDGAVVKTEKFFWRYAPTDQVRCG